MKRARAPVPKEGRFSRIASFALLAWDAKALKDYKLDPEAVTEARKLAEHYDDIRDAARWLLEEEKRRRSG